MKNLKHIIFGLSLLAFMSCERTIVDPEGPPVADLYGELKINNALYTDKDTVDFQAGEKMTFKANLATQKIWTLTIVGDVSGAQQVFDGNAADISVVWAGQSTGLPTFQKETFTATLSFKNHDTTSVTTGWVASTRIFNAVVVTDFEDGKNSKWEGFVQTGLNMDYTVKSTGAPEGNRYFNMAGEVPWDYFIGSVAIPAQVEYGTPYFPVSPASTQVYFNMIVKGNGSKYEGGFMLVNVFEDDNGNGTYDVEGGDDVYTYEFDLDFDGWKIISVPYSSFKLGTIGNRIWNTNHITSVEIGLLIPPDNGFVESGIDLVNFTVGAPFKP